MALISLPLRRRLLRLRRGLARFLIRPLLLSRRRARLVYRAGAALRAWDAYHPLPWLGIGRGSRTGGTLERWALMQPLIDKITPGSAIDLGAQVGYFTFQLAERGWLVLGVESDPYTHAGACLIRRSVRLNRAAFECMKITSSSIRSLPSVDIFIFLSLWHHLCLAEGLESARGILCDVLERTRLVCFFESGQADEAYEGWVDRWPDMSPDPRQWLKKMLLECGAVHVDYLGSTPTHLGPVPRHLFAAWTREPGDPVSNEDVKRCRDYIPLARKSLSR